MRSVALERWNLSGGERRDGFQRSRRCRHRERAWRGRDPVRPVRQEDPMPVMVGRDQLDEAGVIHPVTVGWKARAQRPEE